MVMTVGWRPSSWSTRPPTLRFRRRRHARPPLRSRRPLDPGRPLRSRRSGRPSLPRQRRRPSHQHRPGRLRRPRRRSRAARLPRRVRRLGRRPLSRPGRRLRRPRPSPRSPQSRRCCRRCNSVRILRLEAGRCASISGRGGVAELADAHALGACAARRGGSSPPFPTVIVMQARSSTEMSARRWSRVGLIATSVELADSSRAAGFTWLTD